MLDNTVLLWGSEVSVGNTHSHVDMPIVLAGGCAGRQAAPASRTAAATERQAIEGEDIMGGSPALADARVQLRQRNPRARRETERGVIVPTVNAPADETRYPIPAARHRAELLVERSRFIATVAAAATPEDAAAFVREVSAEFADATHNCWAFVVGPPASTGRIGLSDDGEPHGTAGRPMLTTLLHSGLGDIAAVVTRYYGGVKLGTGGLARAYAGAVNHALASVPRTERVSWALLDVRVDYGAVGGIQQLLTAFEATAVEQEFTDTVRYVLQVPENRQAELRGALMELTNGRADFADRPPLGSE